MSRILSLIQKAADEKGTDLKMVAERCPACGLIQGSSMGQKYRAIYERPRDVCAGCGNTLIVKGA